MREGVSKPVVIIPSVADAIEPQRNTDRPLWALNDAGKSLIDLRSLRAFDEMKLAAGFDVFRGRSAAA